MQDFVSKGRISYIVFVAIALSLCISLHIAFHLYVNAFSREILSNWLKVEYVKIRQGNLLSAVSSHHPALLSSQFIDSIVIYDHAESQVLVAFGEAFAPIKGPASIDEINVETDFFSYRRVVSYRFPHNPDLAVFFVVQPSFANSLMLAVAVAMVSLLAAFFLVIRSLSQREADKRLHLIRDVLEDLAASRSPREELIASIPQLKEGWKLLESRLQDYAREIREHTKEAAVGRITRQVTHDLKGSLAIFEHLSCDEANPKQARLQMQQALSRIYEMIDSIKRGEPSSLMRPEQRNKDWNRLIEEIQMMANRAKKECSINLDPSLYDDEVLIYLDHEKVDRAIANLASNAIEASRKNIGVYIEKREKDLIVQLRDDGEGVDPKMEEKIFQQGITFKEGGTGLGLFFVKSVAHGHGGAIRYYRLNAETVFEMIIPSAISLESKGAELLESTNSEPSNEKTRKVGLVFHSLANVESLGDTLRLPVHTISSKSSDILLRGYQRIITDCVDLMEAAAEAGVHCIYEPSISKKLGERLPAYLQSTELSYELLKVES